MNYQIRSMVPEDIQSVFEIDKRTAALYWPISSYRFETEKNAAARNWVAAASEGTILGFLILWLILDEIHVANFAVDPAYQGRGIGRSLLRRGLAEAWEEGARTSFLEVRKGNESALHLYRQIGYEQTGIRKSYYQDNHEDACLMTLNPDAYKTYILQQEGK